MALNELRAILPAGLPGRIINSFVFANHPDSIEHQRAFRVALSKQPRPPRGVGDLFFDKLETGTFELARGVSGSHVLYRERGYARRPAWGSLNVCRVCADPLTIHMDDLGKRVRITEPTSFIYGEPCGYDVLIKKHHGVMCMECIAKNGYYDAPSTSDGESDHDDMSEYEEESDDDKEEDTDISDAWSIYSACDLM